MFLGSIQEELWVKMANYTKLIQSYCIKILKQNLLTSF